MRRGLFELGADEVLVVRVRATPADAKGMAGLLSAAELERVERMKLAQGRAQFVVGRALARTLLGSVLGADPASLRFALRCASCGGTDHGKPYLCEPDSEVELSIAHSRDLVVVAVARERPVGVDVEAVQAARGAASLDRIARRAFSDDERRELERFEGLGQRPAFFRAWTRKEAFLKGVGLGLAGKLDRWVIGPDGAVSARGGETPADIDEWRVASFDPGPGFSGAVASKREFRVRVADLSPASLGRTNQS